MDRSDHGRNNHQIAVYSWDAGAIPEFYQPEMRYQNSLRFQSVFLYIVTFFLSVPLLPGQDGSVLPAIPEIQRRLPTPGGLSFPESRRAAIQKRVDAYVDKLWEIADHPYSGDVEALVKAVDLAIRHNEFYDPKHFDLAEKYLGLADQRFAKIDEDKEHPWTKERGLIIRGYRSSIDDSCQPYGLEISPDLDLSRPVPLLVWLHGRGDKITDLHFMERCSTKHQAFGGLKGKQNHAIVVHPFGRQCVGWKHAGEIDVLEVIEAVQRDYPIDPDKIALAGFSMGGAGAWHIGAHYREKFCAVSPGAGFAETARYNRLTPETFPSRIEQTLWRVYDTPNYRRNFLNGPLLAYSGEKDKQKAAADLMAEELARENYELRHVIGAGMGHKYHPDAVAEIWDWLRESWKAGRPKLPETISFQTRTLRYPTFRWIHLTGLQNHWEDTRVDAQWNAEKQLVTLQTKNISSFEIRAPSEISAAELELNIDGQSLPAENPGFPVRAVSLVRSPDDGKWKWGEAQGLQKIPGLQGPIDDAFLSRFIVVPPDREIDSPKLRRWIDFELDHFQARWRALMRGELLEEKSSGLDSRDIDNANLILFGDPFSNRKLAEIVDRLPIAWSAHRFTFRGNEYSTADHVPVFIFPNPLNPKRYVVINSGLTFRENHDRTNSLQNPKLPDWAVIGLDQLPDGNAPGKIAAAGFFDEQWK